MKQSWQEEFERKYNKPKIERVTVGFSGIDPQIKAVSSGEIDEEIMKRLSEIEIRIDSGRIDGDDDDTTPEPSHFEPSEINHEELDVLLGGNPDGHYHLTADELEKLQTIPPEGIIGHDGKSATISIGMVTTGSPGSPARVTNSGTSNDAIFNFTIPQGIKGDTGAKGADGATGPQGIQGPQGNDGKSASIRIGSVYTGSAGSSVSITNSGTTTDAVLNFTIPKGDKGDKGEQGDKGDTGSIGPQGLKGDKGDKGEKGNPFTYDDFTATQLEALKGAKGDKGDKGDPFTYDDFTPEQLVSLKGDKGEPGDPAEAGVSNHEELEGLLGGGEDNGHYHMDENQHRRLGILIKALFPTDTDKIYIPYIDDRDPDHPKLLPYTPFEDLPKGSPPEWKIASLPSGYNAHPYIDKMYYGAFPHTTYNDGLFVLLQQGTSSNYYIYNTKNLKTWGSVVQYSSNPTRHIGISYIGEGYVTPTSTTEIIYLSSIIQGGSHYIYCGYNNNSWITSSNLLHKADNSTIATAVSPEMEILLVAGMNNTTTAVSKKLKGNTSVKVTKTLTNFRVNVRGLAWSPDAQLFCLCGQEGTATSVDGENWVTHTDASTPKNLTDLTYREDLECFFARSIDKKIFYASGDGLEWTAVTTTPIPLDTVACVDYAPDTGIYCAVGGTGKYAYFSKDLKTWVSTIITNGADITAGSVIYMPSTGLYVLMPTSGSYYYTFDPSEWVD